MIKFAIAVGLLLLLPIAAQASIADVFQQLDHGTVDDKNFVKTLIVGIEDGFPIRSSQQARPPQKERQCISKSSR
jgi:hypothetical protein